MGSALSSLAGSLTTTGRSLSPDLSRIIAEEKVAWQNRHSLKISPERRDLQLSQLQNFKEFLFLGVSKLSRGPLAYEHYFITDRTWTLEFLKEGVAVHSNPLPVGWQPVGNRFRLASEVLTRMQSVCGGTAYSLLLRNCEHLARYVQTGSWVSLQTLNAGGLRKVLLDSQLHGVEHKLNQLPDELMEQEESKPVYDFINGFVSFERCLEAHSNEDVEAYNVLLVGPPGVGKSRIKNLLFNRFVSRSAHSAKPVTCHMKISSGKAIMLTLAGELGERRVNIIDTVGLQGHRHLQGHTTTLIKEFVSTNFLYIDIVVVVCADRVTDESRFAIKNILSWLNFDKPENRKHFLFVYNKTDGLSQEDRAQSLSDMCDQLDIQPDQYQIDDDAHLPSRLGNECVQHRCPPTFPAPRNGSGSPFASPRQTSDASTDISSDSPQPTSDSSVDSADACVGSKAACPALRTHDASEASNPSDVAHTSGSSANASTLIEGDSADREPPSIHYVNLVMATGFPVCPGSDQMKVKADVDALLDSIFAPRRKPCKGGFCFARLATRAKGSRLCG